MEKQKRRKNLRGIISTVILFVIISAIFRMSTENDNNHIHDYDAVGIEITGRVILVSSVNVGSWRAPRQVPYLVVQHMAQGTEFDSIRVYYSGELEDIISELSWEYVTIRHYPSSDNLAVMVDPVRPHVEFEDYIHDYDAVSVEITGRVTTPISIDWSVNPPSAFFTVVNRVQEAEAVSYRVRYPGSFNDARTLVDTHVTIRYYPDSDNRTVLVDPSRPQ